MSIVNRTFVAGMGLSLAGFVTYVAVPEDFVADAMIPTKNDRPTIGFGSTFHEDGTPVQLGETITPVRALVLAQAHVAKEEVIFRKSLEGARLQQGEFDLYMGWVFQYGTGAWSTSPMRRHILAGEYKQACQSMLEYRYLTTNVETLGWEPYRWADAAKTKPTRWRFDCSIPGNKVCRGVWLRLKDRLNACMAMQGEFK